MDPIIAAIRFQPTTAALPVISGLGLTAPECERLTPDCMLLSDNARAKASSFRGTTQMGSITGTVKFFNTTKGFGFISPEGGGKDAFVHVSAVQQSGLQGLYENDKVTYDVEKGRDGKESAVNLTLL
jgi:cold shock protein